MKQTAWKFGFLISVAFTANADPLIKKIESGEIKGYQSGSTLVFKGIPYATPPVGKLRWKAPLPPAPWEGIKKVHYFESQCAQMSRGGLQGLVWGGNTPAPAGSENCLYLNVWTPASVPSQKPVPVMVYIHGGANNMGSAGERVFGSDLFDGEVISARTGSVVVTLNYRLAAFGFLAHPHISAASGTGSGNYGVMDQILALKWVQKNIGQFGGDNQKVMVFGESAGGLDSLLIFTSPQGRGLFSRILVQSPQYFDRLPTLQEAETQGLELSRALGCDKGDTVACLESKPMEDILKAKLTFSEYNPNIDGHLILESPEDAVNQGHQNEAALVMGANADELSYIWPHMVRAMGQKWPPENEEEYHKHLDLVFVPSTAEEVKREYPLSAFPNAAAAEIRLAGDYALVCPFARTARKARRTQKDPVFQYFYTHTYTASRLAPFGAAHGFELPLVFGNFPRFPYTMWAYVTDAERKLSESLIDYWGRFAAYGDPNHKNAVSWPELGDFGNHHIRLDETITASASEFAHCDFWDKHRNSMIAKLP